MEHPQTSDLLCELALEAGFDRAGVAALRPLDRGPFYLDWLADGMQAGMGYLARRAEVRLDPRTIFPSAQSVLCVALQYGGDGASGLEINDLWDGVARYARGEDYHDIMGRGLATLAERIQDEFPGTETRWYVDTGPVMERELAEVAGLGSVGKNTCLLHPDAGSWFFIGEIFTSLVVRPRYAALEDMCGSCSRCLEACPTDALGKPYELDSSLCISYWTIEHRGGVPHDMRPLLGEWVFGCDICQEVCPHNEAISLATDEGLELPADRGELSLAGLLELETDEYRKLFKGSPMKRAKLEGLKRNAIIAMGNSGKKVHLDALIVTLREGSSLLRSHAAWALGRIGGKRSAEALEIAARLESDSEVTLEISVALESLVVSS